MSADIAFVLNGRPAGGGANSIVQEFTALARHYGRGYLVVQPQHHAAFRAAYGWDEVLLRRVHTSIDAVPSESVMVATTNDSVTQVRKARGDGGGTILYYVQDYEPLFYHPSTVQHEVSLDSYARPNDVLAVVKTQWLRDTLMRETFLPVVRIHPSIDRSLYFPEERSMTGRRTVLAMVRPATPRRAPRRTVAVMNRLAREHSDASVVVFGTDAHELEASGLRLDPAVVSAGRLAPRQVANLMRQSHVFVDLSDYQAFGRTLAEGMACGVVPVATRFGAPSEFIVDGSSGFLVTPSDLDAVYQTVTAALALPGDRLDLIGRAAIDAVAEWNTDVTAADWLALAADVN